MGNASAIGGRRDRCIEFGNTSSAQIMYVRTKMAIANDRRAIGIEGNVATAKDG